MLLFANNARSTLRSAITAASPVLLLEIGTGGLFPAPTNGDTFLVTLQDSVGRIEVVEVSARSGDQLTVSQRGLDGTSAKTFEPGTVVSMRVTAELLRRISADVLRGAPNGVAPLDGNQRLPVDYLPLAAVTQGAGDSRYVRLSELNKPDQPPRLTSTGLLPTEVIPSHYVTTEQGEERYVRKSELGTANAAPKLDANGKLAYSYFPFSQSDFSGLARANDTQLTGTTSINGNLVATGSLNSADLSVSSGANIHNLTVSGAAVFNGGVRVADGATRGRLTVSTAVPSGTPADGDEWYQYTGA